MAGFAQGSVELRQKTSGTNANKDHLRIFARDDEYLFTVDDEGNERSIQYYHSAGVSDSILNDLIDNGNGTANISGCNVRLYKTNDFTGDLYEYYVSGGTFSFIDGTEQYVVADYNNGNPIIKVENNIKVIYYQMLQNKAYFKDVNDLFQYVLCIKDIGDFRKGMLVEKSNNFYNNVKYLPNPVKMYENLSVYRVVPDYSCNLSLVTLEQLEGLSTNKHDCYKKEFG